MALCKVKAYEPPTISVSRHSKPIFEKHDIGKKVMLTKDHDYLETGATGIIKSIENDTDVILNNIEGIFADEDWSENHNKTSQFWVPTYKLKFIENYYSNDNIMLLLV